MSRISTANKSAALVGGGIFCLVRSKRGKFLLYFSLSPLPKKCTNNVVCAFRPSEQAGKPAFSLSLSLSHHSLGIKTYDSRWAGVGREGKADGDGVTDSGFLRKILLSGVQQLDESPEIFGNLSGTTLLLTNSQQSYSTCFHFQIIKSPHALSLYSSFLYYIARTVKKLGRRLSLWGSGEKGGSVILHPGHCTTSNISPISAIPHFPSSAVPRSHPPPPPLSLPPPPLPNYPRGKEGGRPQPPQTLEEAAAPLPPLILRRDEWISLSHLLLLPASAP